MYISHLEIRNFRAVETLSVDLNPHINVIVGPNGVGKTTILQAIRLTKAILASRTQSEPMQVLISLGAASPHFPQRLFLGSLARNPNLPVEVRCTYTLSSDDMLQLQTHSQLLIQNVVSSQAGQNFQNPALLVQFMQSPAGQAAMTAASNQVNSTLAALVADPTILLGITMNVVTGEIAAVDPLAGNLIAFLDQRLPPSQSKFSYFPADRALPMGEISLQVGGPDAQQQLEMHNSQPQIKYSRLKNLLINALMIGDGTGNNVRDEFEKIFSKLLKGRKIRSIEINDVGLLAVTTEELSTGRLVELDSLSSGEKNIALTFLIVASSVANDGIALFDEPELHLNPAVSRDLLRFMIEQYSKPKRIQFILCTHSPEILSGAFSSDDCALLHLKSYNDITRVGRAALDEYADALHRLGTSVSESLLFEGTILVEGVDDVSFLEIAFPELSRRYKIKDRGGRKQIEQTIESLQLLERAGQRVSPIFLIFDKDDEPTNLSPSQNVRFIQWTRRSIENYMLDSDVISEILKDARWTRSPVSSSGIVQNSLRELALAQVNAIAARDAYNKLGYLNPSAQKGDLEFGSVQDVTQSLYKRFDASRASLSAADEAEWLSGFQPKVEKLKTEMLLKWESKWEDLCDGKLLLHSLYSNSDMKISISAFRQKIIELMRDRRSEDWTLVKGLVDGLLAGSA